MSDEAGLLRMRDLCEATGVSAGTVKHYLREGLLPEPVRTSRNMAYYSPEFVDRIHLIKRLQKEGFLPLKVIKEVLQSGPEEGLRRLRALAELEERILERAKRGEQAKALSRAEVKRRFSVPDSILDRMEKVGILTPESSGNDKKRYGTLDVEIIGAVARMRESGYSEALGFSADDLMIYRDNLQKMVRDEVERFSGRVAGTLATQDAVKLVERGVEPLRDLISALHIKLLVAELQAQRAARNGTKSA